MLGAFDAKNDRSPDANTFQPHSDRVHRSDAQDNDLDHDEQTCPPVTGAGLERQADGWS